MAIQVDIKKNFKTFSLQVKFESEGGIMGILGASGCGKSMTLKCIAGVERPDEGRIVVDGRVLFDSRQKINLKPQQRKVGYLFQNYALFPTMSVEKNIACGTSGSRDDVRERVEGQIKRFQLQGLKEHYPSQLSGGQQQRVALARMMISNPDIIMLDEPFSALDGYLKDVLQEEMLGYLREFKGEILMVTHSRDEIFKFCDRLTLLEGGKSLLTGDTRSIFQNPGILPAARLTGCKNFSSVEWIDKHTVYAIDWNVTLHTKAEVPRDTTHVGIRGHWLQPRQEKGENCMRIEKVRYVEAPFEQQHLVRNAVGGDTGRIWWMRSKTKLSMADEQDFPPYLYFPPEEIMLLKDII